MLKSKARWYSVLVLFLLWPLATSLVACAEPKASTHISTEPGELSFVAKAGGNALPEPLEIRSSARDEPFLWEATCDAPWLEIQPDSGTFVYGVSEVVLLVDISGMSVGHHSATIFIFVSEADNSPLSIPAELYVETPEDPAAVSAREFWESSRYKRYWDWNAASDARNTVKSYEFPPPGETKSSSQEIEIKNIDLKYDPAMHERPIAIVHCKITWHRAYVDEQEVKWLETWTANWDVLLEVQPAPYDYEHNEWEIIEWYPHVSE